MEKYINQLTDYIRNANDFKFLDISTSYNYAVGDSFSLSIDNTRNLTNNNMGATIIDGILQAGLNYKNVVKPRVDKFKNEHRTVKTTTDFYNLISTNDLSELINMKGQKIERIHTLVKFLKNEKIETEDDFYTWLLNNDNLLALSNLKGIKGKTIDYLKILTGHKESIAIDSRLLNFIKICCPDLDNMTYEFAKELLMKTAKNLRVDPATLDFSIWTYMTDHKKSKISKIGHEAEKHEVDQMWNGYCPESQLQGKLVRMRLNQMDFFESEETGLQISIIPGVQAVILNFRGKGKFRTTPIYGDEIENGEMLSPQNSDKPPFNNPPTVFGENEEIEKYISKINLEFKN